jgi:spermidine synthase
MPRPARPRRSIPAEIPSPLPAWGLACFFASGAAGLLYEVVWSKQLAYLLGSSLHAVATVVAAFLCGLALGARFLGVPLSRRGRGPRTYALLEIGVGVLGVLMLPLLRGLEPLVGELYRALGGESPAFALARFALLFVLLVPPAALMGATLPVLVGHFERDLVGSALARLYAINTFGAVAGSVAGGFALMPGLGLLGTSFVAAALNAAVALLAWLAGGSAPAAAPATPDAAAPKSATSAPKPASRAAKPEPLAGAPRAVFAILFALSGFAALVFQIAWVRLFTLVFGSSVYSFSAVLGVYLLGLAIGSAVVARFMRGASLAGFGLLQLAIGLVAALELHAFAGVPDRLFALIERTGARWESVFLGEAAIVAAFLIVPCALLGAAFPIATRLLQRRDGGHAAGFAYAVNTAGTIAGSLLAGFFMVPAWGVQGTHVAALLTCVAIGVVALALARARREASFGALAAGLIALIGACGMAAVAPRWDPALMSAGVYRPAQAMRVAAQSQFVHTPGSTVFRASRSEHVLYYREGVNGSVLLGTDDAGTERWLRVGGKIDASTGDMETQVLLGLIPAALADSGARTLVIGLGSGVTAAAVLAAGAGPTDVVEIEPGVVEASRWFFPPGAGPLDDPRVRLVVGDARTHLEHGAGRYGLVVSEPSNPWIAGVNNLFTVDFYRRVKSRLEPGGVFCQWMQLYELTPETFASMVASFMEVFPEGEVFSVWRAVDVLLIAVPDGRRLALERLETPAARHMLERAKIGAAESIAGHYAVPLDSLRRLARGAPLNRDDRPIVEYRAPRDLVAVGRVNSPGDSPAARLIPFAERLPKGPLFAAWGARRWYEARARFLIEAGDARRATIAANGAEADGFPDLAAGLRPEIVAGERRARAQQEVENARQLITAGRLDEGRLALERATEIDPSDAQTWLMLADRRRIAGDLAGSDAALARASADPDPVVRGDAAVLAGLNELNRKGPLAAAELFREAQRRNPKLVRAYLFEARARSQGGDKGGALAAVHRGLEAVPNDPDLVAMLATIEQGK